MNIKELKQIIKENDGTSCVEWASLNEQTILVDTRSFKKDYRGHPLWHVHPVAICPRLTPETMTTHRTCLIICPLCGHIHKHGYGNGHRIEHCTDDRAISQSSNQIRGYVLVGMEEVE